MFQERTQQPPWASTAQRMKGKRLIALLLVAPAIAAFPSARSETNPPPCLSRDQALERVRALRDEGKIAAIRTGACVQQYYAVGLTGFTGYEQAKAASDRLAKAGIQAYVHRRGRHGGWIVWAGAFQDSEPAHHRLRRIAGAGFKDAALYPVQSRGSGYIAVVTGTQTTTESPKPPEHGSAAESSGTIVLGNPPPAYATPTRGASKARAVQFFLDRAQVEAGWLPDQSAPTDNVGYVHVSGGLRWLPNPRWDVKLAARVDGYSQSGGAHFNALNLDYDEDYVRYHGHSYDVTLGTQRILWGRVDEIPPTDQISVKDLTRGPLDKLKDRRRTELAARLQLYGKSSSLDLVLLPVFRGAELPDFASIWSPVDQRTGRVLGRPPSPTMRYLVSNGSFEDDVNGVGGAGARWEMTGHALDGGVTLQRVRQSLPYFELDTRAREVLLATGNPAAAVQAAGGDTFHARHPWTWVAGGDMSLAKGPVTWRAEAAWQSDVAVTDGDTLRMRTVPALDWVVGGDFFPGDRDLRVTLQLAGHELITPGDTLERHRHYLITGDVEAPFDHARWSTDIRFRAGLDRSDFYLNPELRYEAWEPNVFYVGAHFFSGAPDTLGGFYQDNSMVVVGWRTRM